MICLRAFDWALRIAGAVLSFLMGTGLALLEVVRTPGFWLMPVLAAAVGNALLVWFARSTVDVSWAWLFAAVPWAAVMVASVGSTSEGDQLANSLTGLATFGVGAFAFFVAAFWSPAPKPGAAQTPDLR